MNDERSKLILHNCRQAIPEHGTLLVIERIVPDRLRATGEHQLLARSDLDMLIGPGGRERPLLLGLLLGHQLMGLQSLVVTVVLPVAGFFLLSSRMPVVFSSIDAEQSKMNITGQGSPASPNTVTTGGGYLGGA